MMKKISIVFLTLLLSGCVIPTRITNDTVKEMSDFDLCQSFASISQDEWLGEKYQLVVHEYENRVKKGRFYYTEKQCEQIAINKKKSDQDFMCLMWGCGPSSGSSSLKNTIDSLPKSTTTYCNKYGTQTICNSY